MGRGTPVFLYMAQAKICKTIGRHAPDAQSGRAVLDLLDGRMLLLATHDVADARALDISDIITL